MTRTGVGISSIEIQNKKNMNSFPCPPPPPLLQFPATGVRKTIMRRGSSVATSSPRPLRSGSRTRAASADHGVGGGGGVFTSEQIAAATRGQVLRRGGPGSITTDSRTARQGTWFLGLKGERYDGRMFASEAIARGCAGVVLEARDEEEAHKLRQR